MYVSICNQNVNLNILGIYSVSYCVCMCGMPGSMDSWCCREWLGLAEIYKPVFILYDRTHALSHTAIHTTTVLWCNPGNSACIMCIRLPRNPVSPPPQPPNIHMPGHNTVESVLKDHPMFVIKKIWYLKKGCLWWQAIALSCGTFCQEYVVLQDRWSLVIAVVFQDRFDYTICWIVQRWIISICTAESAETN